MCRYVSTFIIGTVLAMNVGASAHYPPAIGIHQADEVDSDTEVCAFVTRYTDARRPLSVVRQMELGMLGGFLSVQAKTVYTYARTGVVDDTWLSMSLLCAVAGGIVNGAKGVIEHIWYRER